jgi:ketosteroid isomerase-like protein
VAETNADVLRRHLAAEAAHDATAAAATYTDDGFYELVPLGLRFEGRDMVEFQYAASYGTIRNMVATYQWEHAEGDTVVQCGRITGEAGDEMLGVAARGGRLDFPFTAVITFRDGKMAGEHVFYDLDLFCEQAGLDVDAVRTAAAAVRGSEAATA